MGQRDAYFDNAKFILIVLVLFGHFINSYVSTNVMIEALYKTIYSFHMPAFVFISGLFAKGFYQKGYLLKITKRLLIPYLIFQTIYTIYYYYLHHHSTLTFKFLEPRWTLWFLLSMFCWNILLLVFAKWKPVIGMSVSIFLALIVGFIESISSELSISRTFVFFPFFLMGYYINKDRLKQAAKIKVRFASVFLLILVLLFFYGNPDIDNKWFFGSHPYVNIETVTLLSMWKRLAVTALGFVMVFSFLSLIPRRHLFFTELGKYSLYIYLLHGFFIRFFRESEWVAALNHTGGYLILAACSVLLACLLSSTFVTTITEPIIELKISRLKAFFKRNIPMDKPST